MPDPLNRKPWPMKWVVLAIIVCVIPYTWVTLKYRKAGPAYQPYEDSKQRANVMRLLDAGYKRLHVTAERPADLQQTIAAVREPVAISPAPGGLTPKLAETLVEIPQLPKAFTNVTASGETAALLPYPVVFTCTLANQKQQLGGAQVFVRENSVVIVPTFEPLSGELTARTNESTALVTLPAGSLAAGDYTVLLAGTDESRQWTLRVK